MIMLQSFRIYKSFTSMWLEEIKKESCRSINICCYESETPSVLYFWFSFPKTCTVLRRISKEIGFKSCPDPYNKLEGEETWIGTDSPWLPYHSAWCQTDVQLGSYAPQKTESPWIPGWCWSLVALPLPHSPILHQPQLPHTVPLQSPSLITSTQGSPDW